MKFLKEDGTIDEGVQLSDADAARMERLESVLHASVCSGSYHASYGHGVKKCRRIAAAVVASGRTLEAILEDEFLPKMEDEHPSPVPTGVEA